MSTYSTNLRIELIGTGEQAGTWGTTTNTNLGTLIEKAISGSVSVTVSVADTALTALEGADDQSRNMMLVLDTSTGANFNVYTPPSPKLYIVRNASGSYTATVYNSTVLGNTTAAGTGVAVAAGQSLLLYTDGTNFRTIDAANLTDTLAVANGGTGATSLTANNIILGNGTSAVQTVAPGTDGNFLVSDGTTWTTESGATARTSMGLGSIATQNADSVTITGGSMTDMTSVTVSGAGRISGNGALPAGAVSAFAMTTAPTGWLECDGSAVSRSTYSDLYAAIGIQFGPGDTVTTFNLPDLRGQFIRGWDNGRGLDPGRSFSGDQSDAQESKINSFTTTEAVGGANPPGTSNIVNGNSSYRETGANDAGNGTAIRFNATVGTETRPTNVALMYCIKT